MKLVSRLIRLLLLAMLLGAQPHTPARAAGAAAPAGGQASFTFLGGLGGKIFGSTIDGTLAYLLEGNHLTILDISDPDAPRLRSRTGIPGRPYSLTAAKGYAYVLRYGTLWVYDARNPDAPTLARTLDSGRFRLSSMTVAEDRLWLSGPGLVSSFDLRDPTRPAPLGDLTDAVQLQVVGPLAYIVNKNQGLTIWDVSDPRAPFLRGQAVPLGVSGPVYYQGVAVDGSTLYLVASVAGSGGFDATIFTYDVGDPAKPNQMASGTIQAGRLYLLDGKLLTTAPGELVLYSMADPGHPARVASAPLSDDPSHHFQVAGGRLITWDEGSWQLNDLGAQGLTLRGQYQTAATIIDNAVLAGGRLYAHVPGGIQIIDVSRPLSPTLQALIPLGYTAFNDVSIDGTRLLKPTGDALELIDASDPLSPTVRAVLPAARAGRLQGDRAYVASNADPDHPLFQVLDISDMASPSVLGSVAIAAGAPVNNYFHVLLDGGRAYVGQSSPFPNSTPVLTALDVSDPRQPRAGLPFSPTSGELVAHGTLLLSLGSKLQVIDLRDINAPAMADYSSSGAQRGVQFVGSTLFVADYNGLAALDLSDPQHPKLLSRFRFADGSTGGLQILDGRAYTFSEGLRVLDIRSPASMLPVAMTHAYVDGFIVADSYLYVWMWDGGLQIIQIHPERFNTPLLLPLARKGV